MKNWDVTLTAKELAKLLGFNGKVVDVFQNEDRIEVTVEGEKIKKSR